MKCAVICLTVLFWFACAPQIAPATEPVLTDAEQQTLKLAIINLDSADPPTLDSALQSLLAMGPKAAAAVGRLTEMLADDRQLTYPD